MRALYDKRKLDPHKKPQELKTNPELCMNLHSERRLFAEKPEPREVKAQFTHGELGKKLERLLNTRKRKTAKMANNADNRRTGYVDAMEMGRHAVS